MTDVKARRRELVEEFRRNPIGRHSPDLRVLLNTLRCAQDTKGWSYALLTIEPDRLWRLARKHKGGGAIESIGEATFASPEEAERAVFDLLWRERFGEDPP